MDRIKTLGGLILALAGIALGTAGCSRTRHVAVGSKGYTEQQVLAEIAAQHVEHRLHIKVDRRLNLGGTRLAHQALLTREIDFYPEYTSTALAVILMLDPEPVPQQAFLRVRGEYERSYKMQWLHPLGINSTLAIVVRGDDARKYKLETMSDAAKVAQTWKLGVGYEFLERKDGFSALTDYHFDWVAAPKSMDAGQLYHALEQKQVNMIAGYVTDGLLSALDVKVLTDDRKVFGPYQACFVVRDDTLAENPRLRDVLEELSGKFTNETMRKLDYEVDAKHRSVQDVAAEFLHDAGLQ